MSTAVACQNTVEQFHWLEINNLDCYHYSEFRNKLDCENIFDSVTSAVFVLESNRAESSRKQCCPLLYMYSNQNMPSKAYQDYILMLKGGTKAKD